MIQINLLPDVKQEYLRARRNRNLAISISILVGAASVVLVILLLLALGAQTLRDMSAEKSIKDEYKKLSSVADLSELVTIQNQLTVIGDQHQKKTIDSRVFSVLQAINPSGDNTIQYTSVKLDPETSTLTIQGVAKNGYAAVNALKKTIENTKVEYKDAQSSEDTPVTEPIATKVTLGESGFGETSDGTRVLQFTMTINYLEQLFNNRSMNIRILGPDGAVDVTDSKIGVPDSLFTTPVEKKEGQ